MVSSIDSIRVRPSLYVQESNPNQETAEGRPRKRGHQDGHGLSGIGQVPLRGGPGGGLICAYPMR
jgi:hypothetical protein